MQARHSNHAAAGRFSVGKKVEICVFERTARRICSQGCKHPYDLICQTSPDFGQSYWLSNYGCHLKDLLGEPPRTLAKHAIGLLNVFNEVDTAN